MILTFSSFASYGLVSLRAHTCLYFESWDPAEHSSTSISSIWKVDKEGGKFPTCCEWHPCIQVGHSICELYHHFLAAGMITTVIDPQSRLC